jgi:multiple sugar transport system permease protein
MLAFGAAFVVLPFAWTVYASFVPNDLDLGKLFDPSIYGAENYASLITDSPLGRWWINSMVVTAIVMIGNLVFDTAAGYALARFRFPGRGVLLGVIVVAMIVPPQVLFVPIYTQVIGLGWQDTYAALTVPFLVNPFGVFLMRQHFVNFPPELEDAGRVDGLNDFGVFARIAVPAARPALAALAIFMFVWTWNTFAFPSVLVTSQEMFTLPVGLYQVTHTTFTNHVALAMAGVVLTTVPALAVFGLLQRRFVQTLAGATKG